MELTYQELKARHRHLRDDFSPSLSLRTHRALSWLQRAEQETDDLDAQFIFLWISFNAAYANEIHDRKQFTERRLSLGFLKQLIKLDTKRLLYQITWDEFPKSIRLLIDNKYVYQPFWEYQNGRLDGDEWLSRFSRSKASANRALGKMDTQRVLATVFDRLYVLRNQMVHGGATWNSGVNREQIRDGANIMRRLVPTIIHIMMDNGAGFLGEPCYPVVD